jgi:hypothetical protein
MTSPEPGSFQSADELVEAHGYPVLAPALKVKVFGLNGARACGPEQKQKIEADPIGRQKAACRARPAPTFETFGPMMDRGDEALLAERKGLPA